MLMGPKVMMGMTRPSSPWISERRYITWPISLPVPLHHEIQLRDKGGIVPEDVQDIMLQTSGAVHIPERFPDEIFNFSLLFLFFQTDTIIFSVHCFSHFLFFLFLLIRAISLNFFSLTAR